MSLEIKVTVDFSDRVIEALNALGVGKVAAAPEKPAKAKAEKAEAPKAEKTEEPKAVEAPKAEKAEDPKAVAPTAGVEDPASLLTKCRTLVSSLVEAGKRSEVVELLTRYIPEGEKPNVTKVPTDKLEAFYKELKAI